MAYALWAASIVYEASKRTGETRGQREFKVYGSEVTLRKNYNRLPHESKSKQPKHNSANGPKRMSKRPTRSATKSKP